MTRDADLDNPSGSVFCAHGAGFVVPWDQVPQYMHVESCLKNRTEEPDPAPDVWRTEMFLRGRNTAMARKPAEEGKATRLSRPRKKSWKKFLSGLPGAVERRRSGFGKTVHPGSADIRGKNGPAAGTERRTWGKKTGKGAGEKEYLLVDGYNIIFAWEELSELAAVDIAAARGKLMDILSNYQGYKKYTVILVFDAYKVEGGTGEIFRYHNIHVVFTKEAGDGGSVY